MEKTAGLDDSGCAFCGEPKLLLVLLEMSVWLDKEPAGEADILTAFPDGLILEKGGMFS